MTKKLKRIKPKWENGSLHPDSPNKVFCTAPWTHTYISPQSERRICCASREKHDFQVQYIDASWDEGGGNEYNPIPLKDHWNSEYMKGIRRDLLEGKTRPECQVCNDEVLSLSTYRAWFTGYLFKDKIDEIYETTLDDLIIDLIIHVDLNVECVVSYYLQVGKVKRGNMDIGVLKEINGCYQNIEIR